MSAEELKNLGNKAFSAGDHPTAIKHFTDAIALDQNNHILFSNRSAAYASLKDYTHALEDAQRCVALKPDWSKGYGRLGSALLGLKKLPEAEKAYQQGLEIDPNNELLKKGLEDVYDQKRNEGTNMIAQAFSAPDAIMKIANNPKTKAYLSQPDFLEKFKSIQANPNLLQMHLSDPRIMATMGVLLNLNIGDFNDMEAEPESQPEIPKREEPKREELKKEESKKEEPKKQQQQQQQPEPEDSKETSEEVLNKKKALEEKELGTQFYKKKDFNKALEHYTKASELDPTNISHLTNISAVYFEMGDYDKCIQTCEKAVETGREVRADYQLIARAFGRMGNAYHKKDDLDNAIIYFNKSLTEHRNPEILTKLKEIEKLRDIRRREAYINPELAVEARERGNKLFKEQKYADSVKEYTEATKRDPKDAKNFSNRAAAYTKLLAFPEAIKDCEEALRLDPKFVKAYIRKANVEIAMKKTSEALTTLREASEQDTEGAHTSEIADLRRKCYEVGGGLSDEERASQAENDPQVQEILSDPVMRTILGQIQQNPKALQEHLKNPVIAKKIQKLFEAGIIRTG